LNRKLKILGTTVTIIEGTGDQYRKNRAWTYFDENNQWTRIIHVYKHAENKDRLIAHEIAEGLLGAGYKIPAKHRHELIKPLEQLIHKELTFKRKLEKAKTLNLKSSFPP